MKVLLNWVVSAIVVLVLAFILPGVTVSGFWVALVTALVLGLINAFVRPLVLILTLPLNILTLGLFTLVVNTFMVLLADWIVPGFEIATFWWALLFSIAFGLINTFLKEEKTKVEGGQEAK